jgi:3-deoxy-7-phosphoheptulonate synthase
MIIVMRKGASKKEIEKVSNKIEKLGYGTHHIVGVERTVIGAVGDKDKERLKALITMPGVEKVMSVLQPYKIASRSVKKADTVVTVNGIKIGDKKTFVVMAGPCAVETKEQTIKTAQKVKEYGAQFLRGGAFKPRTSPYSFQGLEEDGLKILAQARKTTGLPIVTELMSVAHTKLVDKYADIIQIGARNMQNFNLLKAVGELKKPVLLKRGHAATLEELLMSAEYILAQGNYQVILCERGIRTFETAYRNTLDLNAIPALKGMTHLPIIVDPSHGTGKKDLILPMAKAAIAAGADGLMIEVHPHPEEAYSDGPQSLTPKEFAHLMEEIKPFVKAVGRELIRS